MAKAPPKYIPKLQRSRFLILFCRGPKEGKKCGYAIDLNKHTQDWETCPLCGGKLHRQWHYNRKPYSLDTEDEPYYNSYSANNRSR